MPNSVKFIDRGLKAIRASFLKANGARVEAGLVGTAAAAPHPDRPSITIGQVGIINELGTRDGKVPARPTVKPVARSVEMHQSMTQATAALAIKNEFRLPVTEILTSFGVRAVELIRHAMDDTEHKLEKNKPATVKWKGFDHPLTGLTGALRKAVSYRILGKGGEQLGSGGGDYSVGGDE